MGLTRTVAPATDFVTLDEAIAHCRVTTDTEAGLIQGYLFAARELVEHDTRRAFITQQWQLTLDSTEASANDNNSVWPTVKDSATGYRIKRIVLPKPPLQSVDSFQYIDLAGVTQTLDPSQYIVSKMDTDESVIEPAYRVVWPIPQRRSGFATINFTTGYGDNIGDVPEQARQAVLMLVGLWFDYRVPIATAQAVVELPYGPEQLIYRLRVFY